MIQVIQGNIFDSPAQVLVNPVNTMGVMGAGLALQFKQKYPEMFKTYRKYCLMGQFEIGMLQLYQATDNKTICNFPTKRHWRNKSKLSYIEAGLEKLVMTHQEKNIKSIAFPKLGCGLGGLSWDDAVKPLLHKHLDELALDVFIHL